MDNAIHISILQLATILAACGFFLLAFWLQLRRFSRDIRSEPSGTPPPTAPWKLSPGLAAGGGVMLVALVLVSRAVSARRLTLGLSNYFDAFILLALLLTALWAWFEWTRHLRSLALFLLPTIAILILIGAGLDMAGYRMFHTRNPWMLVHVGSILLGAACFAAGCASGVVYLLAERRLRFPNRSGGRWLAAPPLASVEKFNRHAILLGFPLLTIAAVTGALWAVEDPHTMGPDWFYSPKVILTALLWLVYASLLHVRLAPALRGSRAAWLSIAGFVLLLVVFAAANWMPGG